MQAGVMRAQTPGHHNSSEGFDAREALNDLAALVWPVACVGCGAADRELCVNCVAELRGNTPVTVTSPLAGIPTYARGPYEGVLRSVLVAYKHGGRAGFARLLGEQLAHPLAHAIARAHAPPLLIAAPSRASQVRKRGFRHVEAAVRVARHAVPDPAPLARALRSTRGRQGQVGLDAASRAANAARIAVRGRYRSALSGREVILIDDIMTTGATVRAAIEALRSVGARVVAVAVIAAVSYEGTPENS